MRRREKNERGAVLLESTYCILLSVLVLFFLLSFGFFLYQQVMVGIVANEVAEEVAQSYKLREVTDHSSVSETDVAGVGKYRYLFFDSSFKRKNQIKAYNFLDVRLSKSSLEKRKGNPSVTVETETDDIGRRHYKVTVRQRYTFLLGDLLSVIGQKDVQDIEAVSYVQGMDVLYYVNTVKYTKYGIGKVKEYSSVLGVIDSAISLLHSIFD